MRSNCSFLRFWFHKQDNRMASLLCAFLCAWSASALRWTSCYTGHTGAAMSLAWGVKIFDLLYENAKFFTQDVFSHKGRAHYANDVPFHKCHSTTASSQCATSENQDLLMMFCFHQTMFFHYDTWWSSRVSLCLVEKSHPGSLQVSLFGCRWTYLNRQDLVIDVKVWPFVIWHTLYGAP